MEAILVWAPVATWPYKFVAFILFVAFIFKNEPLWLPLILPITSSASFGSVVPTPNTPLNEPDVTSTFLNPLICPKLPLMCPASPDTLILANEDVPDAVSVSLVISVISAAANPLITPKLPLMCPAWFNLIDAWDDVAAKLDTTACSTLRALPSNVMYGVSPPEPSSDFKIISLSTVPCCIIKSPVPLASI